jgi:hypothetical protein
MYHAARGLAPLMRVANRNTADFSTDNTLLDSRLIPLLNEL